MKLTIRLIGLIFTLLLIGCQQQTESISNELELSKTEGGLYQIDLLNTIKQSDVIKVTEHSDEYDFYDQKLDVQKRYSEKIYKTLELTNAQKKFFTKTIQNVNNKTQDAFAAGASEIHHTIQFYKKGSLFSTLKVCFECGDIDWDGSKHTPPWDIYNGMEVFIKGVGLHPEQDWKKLAKQSK